MTTRTRTIGSTTTSDALAEQGRRGCIRPRRIPVGPDRVQRRRRQRLPGHRRLRGLGARALAVTADSPSYPDTHRRLALRSPRVRLRARDDPHRGARAAGIPRQSRQPLLLLQGRALSHLAALARERGFAVVVDGNNADDRGDYRPGRQAAREHGVRSPLDEADLTKDDIRALARDAGLASWDEPASACLSSRIPYGQEVTDEKLRQIEQAETRCASWASASSACAITTRWRASRSRRARCRARSIPRSTPKLVAALKALGLSVREPRPAGLPPGEPERGAAPAPVS